ncbi:OmpA family protein [candidate division KSB1 bacterium]
MKKHILSILSWVLVFSISSIGFTQERKLSDVETIYQRALDNKASLYSPQNFEQGEKLFKEAQLEIQNNNNSEEVKNKLKDAFRYLSLSISNSEKTKDHLLTLISSRDASLKVNSHKLYPDRFNLAETKFREAFTEAEKGDLKKASSRGIEAEDIFNEIELLAIKQDIVGTAEQLYEDAKQAMADYYALKSFNNIMPSIRQANRILDKDRYDKSEAKKHAVQAEYEARHAIHLANYIKTLNDNENTFEDVILEFENNIYDLAKKLKTGVRFDNGLKAPIEILAEKFYEASAGKEDIGSELNRFINELVNVLQLPQDPNQSIRQRIIDEIQSNRNSKRILAEENTSFRQQVYNLNEDIKKLREQQLTETQGRLDSLQAVIDTWQLKKEKYEIVENLFNKNEGETYKVGNNIIYRLYGIVFPSSKSDILRSHHTILNKVVSAINEFPNCSVIIEGHTDSKGRMSNNNVLSQKRAESVRKFILSNSDIKKNKIKAVGYGQSRPIADNSTEEGRTKNRRIEVILIPFL